MGDDADEDVSKWIGAIVEVRGNLQAVENLHMNLFEIHCKMRHRVQEKLIPVLVPLLDVPESTKYHYWFSLFLDPRYVMEIKDIKHFHQSKNVGTKTIFYQMVPKFYDYIITV